MTANKLTINTDKSNALIISSGRKNISQIPNTLCEGWQIHYTRWQIHYTLFIINLHYTRLIPFCVSQVSDAHL